MFPNGKRFSVFGTEKIFGVFLDERKAKSNACSPNSAKSPPTPNYYFQEWQTKVRGASRWLPTKEQNSCSSSRRSKSFKIKNK